MGDSVPTKIEMREDPFLICQMKCYHLLGITLNAKASEENKRRFKECIDKCIEEMIDDEIIMQYANVI